MDRVGRQSPTVSVILPYKDTDTKGPEAIELYNKSEKDALAFTRGGKWSMIKVKRTLY